MPRGTTNRSASGNGSIRKVTKTRNGKDYTYWEGRCTVGYDPGTGKQKQRTLSAKTQREVAQKLRQIASEIDDGTYNEPCKLTVGEWLEEWLNDYLGDVKDSTAYLYRREIDLHVKPKIGAIKLESLDTAAIQKMYNDLRKPKTDGVRPLSAKSVRNVHGVLHKALQQAVVCKRIRNNPADGCVIPRAEKKPITPFDEDQISLFLKEIQGHPHERLYKITLFTGLREGEILGLTWDCVDFKSGTLIVKQQLRKEQKQGGKYYFSSPKNGKIRVLTLAPSVVNLFEMQKQAQKEKRSKAGNLWEEHNLVFTNDTGGYLSYRTVYDCYKRIVKKIGAPNARFHDLRHSYAVISIHAGDDIKTVQENLGHHTAAFTLDVYGHITKQMRQESASRMERFIQSVEIS